MYISVTFECQYTTLNTPSFGNVQHHKGVTIISLYIPPSPLVSLSSKFGLAPPSVSHVQSSLLTLHRELSLKVWKLGCVQM